MDLRFSTYGRLSTRPSPVNLMMASFAGDFRDNVDINLGVGYVNESTIPVPLMLDAIDAVAGSPTVYRQAFNYGDPKGSANLAGALKKFLGRRGTPGLDQETLERKRLIIGACGATSLMDGLTDVLAPGIVITSDPMYYIYSDNLERKGFDALAIREDGEGPELDLLERKLTMLGDRVRDIAFFYFVTVNNPSCTMLSNARRRALYRVAARVSREQGRRIPIIYDLAYELLLHDPAAPGFKSVLGDDDLGIAYEIGTLSKLLAPALRIGYMLGPDGDLMNAMVQRTSDAGFSAPLFVQEMAAWLIDNHVDEQLATVNRGYREKAVAVAQAIERELGPWLAECRGGKAGFYYYLTFKETATGPSSALFRRLTRSTGDAAIDSPSGDRLPRVIYIPGEYCVQPNGDMSGEGKRQIRLSYAFESVERIAVALRLMREAIEAGEVHSSAKAGTRSES